MTRPYDQSLGALPAPPPRWQDSEESMKGWLLAKTEEEKRRQEEEKTRQGTLRYEQRQIELEILRTSLSGGIPPAMIPFVFAGMGGITLPAGAMEWAEQAISSHHQHHGPQAPTSPGKQRESQPHSTCIGTPNPMPPTHGFVHPGSPAVRSSIGGGSTSATRPISAVHASGTNTPNVSSYSFANQTGPEPQSGIYFHHWQPPSTQTQTVNNNTVSTQSSAPSADSPKKRKASGPPSETRSPPLFNLSSSGRSSISMNGNYSYTGGSGSRQRSSQSHHGHIKQRSESTTARDTSGNSSGGAEIMGPGPGTDRMNFAPQTQAKSQSQTQLQSRPPSSSHSGPTPTPSESRISDARQAGSNNGNSSHTVSSLLADGLQVNQ
ncbi:hypothetical protein Cpir12675_000816 [Ceratocystis pirilliformis]|uniref:Uncharacterized protein n=1 Tax=Ceratocystis pirilliformis TaxID=259994 RepID=A0ABR3ZKC1_9PEZI